MFKKTKIAAVTAAVLGVSAMANAATTTNVTLAENGAGGQVLIFPYYNVNNGFSTSFNITNTTNDFKAIKIRFRESNTSNDVLDFNVYMSPKDVFTMGLTKTADGGVLMQTTDTTCTHPAIPAGGKEFIGADVYDSVTKADVREGYLEVIEMGIIDPADGIKADNSKGKATVIASTAGIEHVDGVPGDCAVITNAWKDGVFTQGGAVADASWVNESGKGYDAGYYGNDAPTVLRAPTGGLIGSSVLIDTVNIAGFVAEPVTIDGYSATAQHYLPSDTDFYLLPSLASGSTATVAALSDDGTMAVSNTWNPVARDFGLDDPNLAPNGSVPSGVNPMPMANALLVTALANQYFVAGETSTDWVVAAPMRKHAIFNDYQYSTGSASTDKDTKDIAIDGTHFWKYLTKARDVSAEFVYYDREERMAVTEPGDFSPPLQTDTPEVPFYREVNILALTSGGPNPSVLGSDNAQTVTMDTGFGTGWGSFDFSKLDLADSRYTSAWVSRTGTMSTKGAPLTGFASARGTVNGQNLGETFPMSVSRTRTK